MKFFLTSDTHFNHEMLVEKGYRPQGYESKIVSSWDKRVGADDTLVHLGDFCVGKDAIAHEVLKTLPGRKILVMGNHDRQSMHWYATHGWDFVVREFRWNYLGHRLLFTHIPEDARTFRRAKMLNIHGHIHHGNRYGYDAGPHHELVSLERDGYRVFELKEVVERFEKRMRKEQENAI